MKPIQLPRSVYRVLLLLPLVIMLAALGLAYARHSQTVTISPLLGTLHADASWRVRLKDNPFYPTQELSGKYAYITELVDLIQIDLDFAFSGAPKDAMMKIDYRVDGVLRIDYDTTGAAMLLSQEYPNISSGSKTFTGSSFTNRQSFDVSLLPYTYVINSFKSAYRLFVSSKFDMNVTVKLSMDVSGVNIAKEVPLRLTIPMDTTVFSITGTPSGTAKLYQPADTIAATGNPGVVFFLVIAVLMLLFALIAYVLLRPSVPNPAAETLKQALQRCKGCMVNIQADPREKCDTILPVKGMADLMCISDEAGQPVLYMGRSPAHHFFVLTARVLYSYEINLDEAVGLSAQDNEPSLQTDSITEA